MNEKSNDTETEFIKKLDAIYGDNETAKDLIFGLRKLLHEVKKTNELKTAGNILTQEQNKKLLELLSNVSDQGNNNVETFIEIKKILEESKIDLNKVIPAIFKDNVIQVKETKEVQKVELTKEVELKEPSWFKQLNPARDIIRPIWEGIAEALKKIFRVQIVNTSDPEKPVAVRLSDGKKFINALAQVIAGGGSSYSFSFDSPYVYKLISAATTNATLIKTAAGKVYGWSITNTNSSPRYVKLYNKASAPIVGTDSPAITIMVPGNANGSGNNLSIPGGLPFGTGIGLAITANPADNDNTAVGANDVIVNLLYL